MGKMENYFIEPKLFCILGAPILFSPSYNFECLIQCRGVRRGEGHGLFIKKDIL